jgi:hypothetical protein
MFIMYIIHLITCFNLCWSSLGNILFTNGGRIYNVKFVYVFYFSCFLGSVFGIMEFNSYRKTKKFVTKPFKNTSMGIAFRTNKLLRKY